jgi:signal transduction histidine kinase
LEQVAARGWVLEEKRPVVEPVSFEAYQKLRQMRVLEKACSLLCVPCRVKSIQVGRFTIGFHRPHVYTAAELEGLRFCADQFAVYSQMHQQLQDTQELSQLRHDYIANVSHELRTPLTTIYGYLNILKSYPTHLFQEDEKQQMFSVMTDECQRLIRLINNLLLSVKVEREDFPGTTSLAPVSLGVVVAQTCRFMERELKSKNVEVQVDVPANLPSIEGNLDLLYQVFQNLIANAIKFSAKDPRVGIVAREEGDLVSISISDNGVGIEEQALTHIFQKFYRAESQAGKRPGLGIGLYLVQKLVELHRGEISVVSKLNEGTTFTLAFPKLQVVQTFSQTAQA